MDSRLQLTGQPSVAMLGDEGVVVEMGIGMIHTVDLGELAGAEGFVWVQAPDAFEQALSAQNFMQSGDAAFEAIGSIEEGSVGVGNFNGFLNESTQKPRMYIRG